MSDPRLKTEDQKLVEEAWKILRSPGGDPVELSKLAKRLKGNGRFNLARRILERAREDRENKIDSAEFALELRQQHALCTYKDADLPKHLALDEALNILNHKGDLARTVNQETLGLTGSIYKRKWEVDARKSNLERSLAYYYERGHKPAADLRRAALAGEKLPGEREVAMDRGLEGYTSINAAFVLDLLAGIEEQESTEMGLHSSSAEERRRQAREVREELVATLPKLMEKGLLEKSWWSLATIAEAQFGLEDYAGARETLDDAKKQEHENWMFETTARQLAQLVSLRPGSEEAAPEGGIAVVRNLLDGDDEAVRSLFHGKLGLALSGGGFRASFYHIGVLARLAEEDLLRHVHVLSCVSGGSIIGAHYYLEVRKLLQEKWDLEGEGRRTEDVITRDDYIELVNRIAEIFFAGVETNLRTSVAGSLVGNIKMAFLPNYSRTDRLGELFEKQIYSKVEDGSGDKRYLDELLIVPREFQSPKGGSPAIFRPKSQNWKRRNKVPMLVLNATSLNTGHNWQFTSTWMGESPYSIDEEVDGNWRLRRMWYSEAPKEYQPARGRRRVRLGKAVGASACVPGLFEPVALPQLYPKEPIAGKHKEMTVRLVDGGVHDNQGVASLLEQDCDVLIVSDASGQMTSQADPGGGIIGTVLRMNSVLMERVRQTQFQDLKARARAGLLKGLMIVHMKRGLEVDPVDWKECEEPPAVPLRKRSELLKHGVLRRIQELLAGIRTDLDSFSEVEANALMTNGYLMAAEYADELRGFPRKPVGKEERYGWPFLRVEPPLYTRGESREVQERVERMLEVANQKAFKIWSLWIPLKILSLFLLLALVAGFVWLWYEHPDIKLLELMPPDGFVVTIGGIGWAAVFAALAVALSRVLGRALGKTAMALLKWRQSLQRIATGLVMATLGAFVAWIHCQVFDRLFKTKCRLDRVLEE